MPWIARDRPLVLGACEPPTIYQSLLSSTEIMTASVDASLRQWVGAVFSSSREEKRLFVPAGMRRSAILWGIKDRGRGWLSREMTAATRYAFYWMSHATIAMQESWLSQRPMLVHVYVRRLCRPPLPVEKGAVRIVGGRSNNRAK